MSRTAREQEMEEARQEMVEAALAAEHERSVRDAFAGAALGAMISSAPMCDRTAIDKHVWSWVAYDFADAMMDARKLSPQEIASFLRGRGL